MKYLLEYEKHEIENLLGDLETLGISKLKQASIWLEYNYGRTSWAISKVLTTEEFYVTRDKEIDSAQILKRISEGEFTTDDETRSAFKGKASTWPEIPELPAKEIQEVAKSYLSTRDLHNNAYKNRNLALGEDKNFLDGFVHHLGLMVKKISIDQGDFGSDPDPEVHYKIYIAPPGSDCHRGNNFYTLPNPVDVVEYKD